MIRDFFSWRPTVTRRATRTYGGAHIFVVPATGIALVRHTLPAPRGACPVSRNPVGGTVQISYVPKDTSLEVVSLQSALGWACARNPGAPQSVEQLARWLATEANLALGVQVRVVVDLQVRPGPQQLLVECVVG